MSRVVVVGGGLGGLAAAARLAKTGHDVTLLERSARLGGALEPLATEGFRWDAGATTTLVPAVLRDLFRKTGRPLERELDLVPVPVLREHRFADGSVLRLPGGSRAAQLAAVGSLDTRPGERSGGRLATAWGEHVADYGPMWESLRRDLFERPFDPGVAAPETLALLRSRESLRRRLRRALPDDRLRLVAAHPFVLDGHDPRDVPAWVGLVAYLEQRFGAWTVPGGLHAVATALAGRMATRGVAVETGVEVRDVVVREGRAAGVETSAGPVDADVVVCAVDPRRLPALARAVARTTPVMPPVSVHVGLEGAAGVDLPDLDTETVLHGDPLLVVRPGAVHEGPQGARTAWSVHARGRIAEDPLLALARAGLDVRDRVVTRIDLGPRDQVERWGGSPLGVRWEGRSTTARRLGPRTPVPGVLLAGAHAATGSGIPFVGLSAALVAQVVGPA